MLSLGAIVGVTSGAALACAGGRLTASRTIDGARRGWRDAARDHGDHGAPNVGRGGALHQGGEPEENGRRGHG